MFFNKEEKLLPQIFYNEGMIFMLIIISAILMIGGAIAAVTGYTSIVAIHLDTIDGLFEVGLVVLIIGFVMFMVSLTKQISAKKYEANVTRRCPQCNELLKQNEIYCHKCGTKTQLND